MAMTVAPKSEQADTASMLDSARGITDTRQRVIFIRDLMLEDVWHKSHAEALGDIWKCAPSTVRNYSAEASRHIKAALNKPLVRARLVDRLAEAIDVAKRELDADMYPRGSPAKVSEAMTKAVLATAQIAGVSVEEKNVPHLTINVGQPVRSAVLDELMGEDEPKAITVHAEPVTDNAEPDAALVVPASVGAPAAVPDDRDGRGQGVAEDAAEGAEDWR